MLTLLKISQFTLVETMELDIAQALPSSQAKQARANPSSWTLWAYVWVIKPMLKSSGMAQTKPN
jgi:hypothetical protein